MKLNWNLLLPENLQVFFNKTFSSKRFSHAYFFVGPKGTNKQKTALYFAQSILCNSNDSNLDILPCGECDHCKQVTKLVHPDLFLVNLMSDSKNISIEQIRDLTQKLSLKALVAKYKIVIIYTAELMTDEAANALLKNLEEPSARTIFILIAENKNSLPETIISRCQIVRFTPISKDEMTIFFKDKNKNEIDKFYRFSQGLPGLIFDFLTDNEIWLKEYGDIQQILLRHSLSLTDKFDFIKRELIGKNYVNDKKVIVQNEIENWIKIFRDVLLLKLGLNHLLRYRELSSQMEKFSKRFSLLEVLTILNQLTDLNNKTDFNLNSQLVLENMYLNII